MGERSYVVLLQVHLFFPESGSLKAKLCVRGKELLYALCASHGVEHRRCGKLTVANSEQEVQALHGLRDRAAANGVPAELLDAAQALTLEPALRCIAALHSPSTGIVDSHGFMLALQGDLERAGGMVALATRVEAARLARRAGEPPASATASVERCQVSWWSTSATEAP